MLAAPLRSAANTKRFIRDVGCNMMRSHMLLLTFLIAGCVAPPAVKQYDAIIPWMPREQLHALIGKPDEVLSGEEYKGRIGYNGSSMTLEVIILKSSGLGFPSSVEIWQRPGRGPLSVYFTSKGTVRGQWPPRRKRQDSQQPDRAVTQESAPSAAP